MSSQGFCSACQLRLESCCVTGMGQYLWVLEDHTHSRTPPVFTDSAESHFIPPAFPPRGLRSRSFYKTCPKRVFYIFLMSRLKAAASHGLTQTKQHRPLRFEEVAAIRSLAVKTHSRPQRSCPKFLLLQPTAWMLCFSGDKGSLRRKVTQLSNTHTHTASPEIRASLQGLRMAGYWENSYKVVKTEEGELSTGTLKRTPRPGWISTLLFHT